MGGSCFVSVSYLAAKIWTNQTSVGMRYRKLAQCGTRVQMRYVFLPHIPCVSQQLCDTLQRRFPAGAASYRLVGHSLGSQVVIHATSLLAQAKQHELQATAAAAAAAGGSGAPGSAAPATASFMCVVGCFSWRCGAPPSVRRVCLRILVF